MAPETGPQATDDSEPNGFCPAGGLVECGGQCIFPACRSWPVDGTEESR